jgi:hypothetical protein
MPRVPKGKRMVTVYISEDLYKLLWRMAPELYGKGHGAISHVVEEALKQYLYPLARTHTKTQANPKMSVKAVYDLVVAKVREVMNMPFKPYQVPEQVLNRAIALVRGPTLMVSPSS